MVEEGVVIGVVVATGADGTEGVAVGGVNVGANAAARAARSSSIVRLAVCSFVGTKSVLVASAVSGW